MTGLQIVDSDGGSLVLRTARKAHRCAGSMGGGRHAPGCPTTIEVGEVYLECYWTTSAYQSGDRYAGPCALALGPQWVAPDPAPVFSVHMGGGPPTRQARTLRQSIVRDGEQQQAHLEDHGCQGGRS